MGWVPPEWYKRSYWRADLVKDEVGVVLIHMHIF